MHTKRSKRSPATNAVAVLAACALVTPGRAATSDGPPASTTRQPAATAPIKRAATTPAATTAATTTQSGTAGRPASSDGTSQTPGSATGAAGGSDRSSSDGGGRRGNRDSILMPIIGAAALVAIGALLTRERQPAGQPGPAQIPQDQLADRLLREGPHLANEFNMSAFAVRGFVRGGWPMLIDFEQRSPGTAQLRISGRDLPEVFTYELSEVCPRPRRCLIQFRLPPEIFGDQLRPAVIAAIATDDQGQKTQPGFVVHALGAGPRAVGSVAIDQVTFGPSAIRVTEQQSALYRFYSHSDFSNTSVEFWKVENRNDGSKHSFVDDRFIEGGVQKNQWIGMNERKEWNGLEKGQKISSGRHKVQVRAWDRVGDWVTAWSDSMVLVAK